MSDRDPSLHDLRASLASQLRASQAQAGLERAVRSMPLEAMARRLEGHPHTAWELLEHLRLAAEDLVDYCRDADYEAPAWPEGYWPTDSGPSSKAAWEESARRLRDAVAAMASLVEDEDRDLFRPVPAAEKPEHNVFRCALVLLDHDAYHVGQLVALRRGLGCW